MLHLLQDTHAIRFTDGKRINLKLLKNQIDRRILKITALVNGIDPPSHPNTERPLCNTACQASIDSMNFSVEMSHGSKGVLGDLNGNDMIALGKRESKLKWKNESSSYLILGDSDFKLGKEEGKTQTNHDQGIVKRTNSEQSCDNSELNLDLSNIKFDENISYEEQANDLKNYIRNTLSNRKKTMTDRSKVQAVYATKTQRVMVKKHIDVSEAKVKQANRIFVSCACMQRMQKQLDSVIPQKRQYQMDYKARTNLLKKIQQKYGNDIM